MGVFRNRPLAAAALLLIAAVAAAFFLPRTPFFLLCAALVLSVPAVILLTRRRAYLRLVLLLLVCGAAAGLFRTFAFTDLTARALTSAVGETREITFSVEENERVSAYASEYTVRVTEVDGTRVFARAALRVEGVLPFYVGDRVTARLAVHADDYDNFYENEKYAYLADGCRVILTLPEETEIGEAFALAESGIGKVTPRILCRRLSAVLRRAVDGEEGELLSAMLLGTRDTLPATVERDFRRVGTAHLFALSGLHLGILAGMLEWLLRRLRVGKSARLALVGAATVGYLALTGFSVSLIRAAMMLGAVYLAYFLRADADGLTALCVTGAAILLVSPNAVFGVSYQLTMLATFGLLVFKEASDALLRRIRARQGILRVLAAALRAVLSSVLLTVSALVATLPVTAFTFGEFSVLTPLSNLVMIPLTAPFLAGGVLSLVFCGVPFLNEAAAFVTRFWGKAMLAYAAHFAPTDAVLSVRESYVTVILLVVIALTALLLLFDLRKAASAVFLPTLCGVAAFAVCFAVFGARHAGEVKIAYRADGASDGFVLTGERCAFICDISTGSTAQLNADWRVAREAGAADIDVLMLTHYHTAHKTAIARLSEAVYVRALWLPEPQTARERSVLSELLGVAERAGIPVTVYRHTEDCTVFSDVNVLLDEALYEDRSTQPALALTISRGDFSCRYEAAAYREYADPLAVAAVSALDVLIVGAHGPKPHKTMDFAAIDAVDTVVLSGAADAFDLRFPKTFGRYLSSDGATFSVPPA